ncbi:OsmC family protein [Aquibacillus sp. 3ASR75-11]|uniref:OsmC family protein n=1 Tax=Terrihalobacillus insolitus TaxID=2950438 RepID=A0A9X3WRL9_9BACI|nr:OsmC family protein [Terrihalobacillus insolitus]MDC3423423.1 OsmC family protein [Terrihalobacillus insolitus]
MSDITTNPYIRKIDVTSSWKGNFQTEHKVREFSFKVDEPEKIGGDNLAPTPLEYVLGSLNGCLLVVIKLVAEETGFHFQDIDIASKGWVDKRGLKGEPVSPYYQRVDNTIMILSDESEDRFNQLKELVLKRCPLYNLIKDANVEIVLNWRLSKF